jgi:membrane protein
MKPKTIWMLVKNTISEWQEDKALRLGAALSYYTIFSLTPLLIIVIGIAGIFFGNDVARDRIMTELNTLLGKEGGSAIGEMLQQQQQQPSKNIIATIIGLITLLIGATGVVGELQDSLNTIWNVENKSSSGLMGMLRQRLLSLGMILGIGFLLLVSLVVSTVLTGVASYWQSAAFFEILNFVLSLAVITVLFAVLLKFLPAVKITWRTVWVGAFVTALLFTIGKTLIGLYLSKSAVASSFGAGGSLVIILVWVYYNSQILFLGAEFTQVYSKYLSKREMAEEEFGDVDEEDIKIDMDEDKKAEIEIDRDSPAYKIAYQAGYQSAKLASAEKDVEHKWKLAKIGAKIVNFIGFRRSAKLAWKGYKVKKKVDQITGDKKEEARSEDRANP